MSRSGTGEVIRGHAMGAGDRGRGHGNGKAIAAAGREEVERGLDKLEGKRTRTSAAGVAPTGQDPNAPQTSTATADPRAIPSAEKAREEGPADVGGYPADKGTTAGVAPTGRDPNDAPQTSRADPSAEKAREEGPADVGGYPADRGTTGPASGSAEGGDVPGRTRPGEYRDEQTGSHAVPRARPQAAAAAATRNGPSGHHDADVEPRTASGDPENLKQTRDVANVPRYGDVTSQEQPPFGTEAQTEEGSSGRPADADSG